MNKFLRSQQFLFAYNSLTLVTLSNIRFYSIRTIKPITSRPRRKKDEVYIEEMKGEVLKYRGGKKGRFVVSGLENALRGVGLSERQLAEQYPLAEEEDTDELDDTILHGEEHYDIHYKEQQARRSFIEKKQTIRKYFKEPPETNLLTAAAKEQIRYLHSLDPIKWDAEKLSESFPISVSGVKKLLRSNFVPETTERRQKHDNCVANNIKLLKEGKKGVSPITLELWKEGKLKLEYSTGNVTLPMPTRNTTNKLLQIQSKYPEKVGQFLAIVKPYLDLKEKESLSNSTPNSTTSENQQYDKNENIWEVRVGPSAYRSHEDTSDDPLCASFLTHKVDRSGPDVTFEGLKKEIKIDSETPKYTNNIADGSKIEPFNPSGVIDEDIPKYENNTIELLIDSKRGSKDMVPYLYESKHGYQHPLGEPQEYPDKIVIPKHLYKPGCKYKVRNSYYDDEGNFLYRTFA